MAQESRVANPFRTVLLATQCTEFDAGAERAGIELAAKCEIPLHVVLPLISTPEYESIAPMLDDATEAEAADKLLKLRESAAQRGVDLIGNVRRGEEPYREIILEASERNADLIVLRRRGKRGFLANLLIGEMVHAVLERAPCDVLTVPQTATLWSRGIVLATDGSPYSQRASQVAAAVAAGWALPLTVVAVAGEDDPDGRIATGWIDSALAVARAVGASADGQIASGKPHEAIPRTVEQTRADLVVLGRRGRNPSKRVLLGSTAERVASHAEGPVLIVRGDS
jgi:nucleotide-binding universal stress UspA family protein